MAMNLTRKRTIVESIDNLAGVLVGSGIDDTELQKDLTKLFGADGSGLKKLHDKWLELTTEAANQTRR